jgi:hypothetical protein
MVSLPVSDSAAVLGMLALGFVYDMFLWKCSVAEEDVEVDFGGREWLR